MDYHFDIDIAVEHSVYEAILIQNLAFWIKKNKANGVNFHDGHYWTYNSIVAYQELFPFWSVDQIRSIIKKLESKGIILIGNYNKKAFDQTKWYTIICSEIKKKYQIDLVEFPNAIGENPKPIPDIKPDTKTNIIKNNIKGLEIPSLTLNLISFWNNEVNKLKKLNILKIPNQHIINKDKPSRLIKDINDYTNNLLSKGSLYSKVDNKLKDNNLKNKKFISADIKRAVRKYMLLFKSGYSYNDYPININKLALSLKDFIYNPKTNLSYFLTIYENEIKLIKEKSTDKLKVNIPNDIKSIYYRLFEDKYIKNNEYNILSKIQEIYTYFETLPTKLKHYDFKRNYGEWFSKPFDIVCLHEKYIKSKWGWDGAVLNLGHLKIDNEFENWVFEETGIKLRDLTDEELENMKDSRKYAYIKQKKYRYSQYLSTELIFDLLDEQNNLNSMKVNNLKNNVESYEFEDFIIDYLINIKGFNKEDAKIEFDLNYKIEEEE